MMTDNSRFVGAVVGAKKLGFDPHIIVQKVYLQVFSEAMFELLRDTP